MGSGTSRRREAQLGGGRATRGQGADLEGGLDGPWPTLRNGPRCILFISSPALSPISQTLLLQPPSRDMSRLASARDLGFAVGADRGRPAAGGTAARHAASC